MRIAIFICRVERISMWCYANEAYVTCAHLLSQTEPYGSRYVPKKVNRSINHCPVITKWSIIDHYTCRFYVTHIQARATQIHKFKTRAKKLIQSCRTFARRFLTFTEFLTIECNIQMYNPFKKVLKLNIRHSCINIS